MSTFDGFVKEFPNIRIDYFRLQPGRPPPAACFLSHVHSDHLQGLESLKMPFVYCSLTTKRLLLRMEKFPHRMNFAKGILESRKQHYRHLKLVLRALPLQTATELELGPKSSIRVTLLDANHCPGAVMFLVENPYHSILYTGDIRSEPWWVNSLVQNPVILPYACGQKRLDCLYLDTTFASREDEYKNFPTRAEGLKELLAKISHFPDDTIFYFRAWTLGYESVWIALSNLLQSRVHVDDYQLRLFASMIDHGGDGYSMFEGPSLSGFVVGNQTQSGCLTYDTSARIHSCEPGTVCHAELKKNRNVVWVTPIVSRMEDGSELLELGAGGGVGDLYQVPELEVDEEVAFEALEKVCADISEDEESNSRMKSAIDDARQSGKFKISLEGLGLDSDAEISLKDFVRVISKKQQWAEVVQGNSNPSTQQGKDQLPQQRSVHFPYSRHSSYSELRHLVSTFRPKDVYACTVELGSWSEDVSMSALFGDLCSEKTFHHDQEVRLAAQEVRSLQAAKSNLKRKRDDDSQRTETSDGLGDGQVFESAAASFTGSFKGAAASKMTAHREDASTSTDSITQRPLIPPEQSGVETPSTTDQDRQSAVSKIREAFHAINHGKDVIIIDDDSQPALAEDFVPEGDSQMSLNTSAFDSQHCFNADEESLIQLDGVKEQANERRAKKASEGIWQHDRPAARREAYKAARRSLKEHEHGDWNDLDLRSLGREGHTEEELEL